MCPRPRNQPQQHEEGAPLPPLSHCIVQWGNRGRGRARGAVALPGEPGGYPGGPPPPGGQAAAASPGLCNGVPRRCCPVIPKLCPMEAREARGLKHQRAQRLQLREAPVEHRAVRGMSGCGTRAEELGPLAHSCSPGHVLGLSAGAAGVRPWAQPLLCPPSLA